MKKVLFIFTFLCSFGFSELEENFLNPPSTAKPYTWWHWFAGNISKEGITKDLESMAEVGIGGLQAFSVALNTPPGPVKFNSEEWHELMAFSIEESKRLGIEFGLHNCAGWSSTGGPWVTPELAQKEVIWNELEVNSSNLKSGVAKLKAPKGNLGFYEDIRVIAFPTPKNGANGKPYQLEDWGKKSFKNINVRLTITPTAPPRDKRTAPKEAVIHSEEILDLTSDLDGDRIKLPSQITKSKKKWTIIRFGYTSSTVKNSPAQGEGQGAGLEVDKMSKAAIDLHWDSFIEKVISDAGGDTKVLTNILIDSFEKGYTNWTAGFEKEFQSRRNYNLSKWLPTLTGRVIDNTDKTERFLWDFRKTICELISQNYVRYYKQKCNERGMYLSVEGYGFGNFDEFEVNLIADMPMGEFWSGRAFDERTPRLASSGANVVGRKYVGAEAFTAHGNWVSKTNPRSMKGATDYFFTRGINRMIYHTYVHQPFGDNIKPGLNMGQFGFNFNRNNTWWDQSKAYLDYVASAQSMLQSGRAVKDVLYIYGENVPNTSERDVDLTPKPTFGYDFDKVGYHALKMARVENNKIIFPSGMEYKYMIMRAIERATPSLLLELKRLIDSGARIFAEPPVSSISLENYPNADLEVNKLVKELWVKDGIMSLNQFDSFIASDSLPDFELEEQNDQIYYIARKQNEDKFYFIANTSKEQLSLNATFRVSGKQPELWDAEKREIIEASLWSKTDDGRTKVNFHLKPEGSLFVVFRKQADSQLASNQAFTFSAKGSLSEEPILAAWYGDEKNEKRRKDVVGIISKSIREGKKGLVVSSKSFKGDPAVRTLKKLYVSYQIEGKKNEITLKEGAFLDLAKLGLVNTLPVNYVGLKGRYYPLRSGVLTKVSQDGEVKKEEIPTPAILKFSKPWKVKFGENTGGKTLTQTDLQQWETSKDPNIKYYSGTAHYSNTLSLKQLEKGKPHFLNLGTVHNFATVKINGEELGTLWKVPYVIDIADALKEGENLVELLVTNLQTNRLIGDAQHPSPSTQYFDKMDRDEVPHSFKGALKEIPNWVKANKPNPDKGRYYFAGFNYYKKNARLLPSGISGEIEIISSNPFKL